MERKNPKEMYPIPTPMKSGVRAKLRSMASEMSPIMQIGKGGLTDNLIITVSDALEARELIKLSVLDNAELPARAFADALAEEINAEVVAVIGKKIILYRRSLNSKKHIELE